MANYRSKFTGEQIDSTLEKATIVTDNLETIYLPKLTAIESELAEIMYLQEDEPTEVNTKTLWFDINSTINFNEGGVSIENAETSTTPPATNYWFEPI